jgi:hypothetical protein
VLSTQASDLTRLNFGRKNKKAGMSGAGQVSSAAAERKFLGPFTVFVIPADRLAKSVEHNLNLQNSVQDITVFGSSLFL